MSQLPNNPSEAVKRLNPHIYQLEIQQDDEGRPVLMSIGVGKPRLRQSSKPVKEPVPVYAPDPYPEISDPEPERNQTSALPTRQSLLPQCQKKIRPKALCPGCGIEFQMLTNGVTKYCSQSCAARHIGKRTMLQNRQRIIGRDNVCANCGSVFKAAPSSKRKFCSMECSSNNEALMKQRVASFRSKPRPMMYSRTRKGWFTAESGKRFFARSGWEAIYAGHLDLLMRGGVIKDWEYEAETFWFDKIKRGVRSYLPDFRVTNLDGSIEYHEVKGWMDQKSKTRLKRMAKYHPSAVVKVIDVGWFKRK